MTFNKTEMTLVTPMMVSLNMATRLRDLVISVVLTGP